MKKIILASLAFIFASAICVFIALAGGIEWGTDACGVAAYLGAIAALASFVATYISVKD